MCDKRYNGYTNYQTWNVALWIDNDEGSQSYWQEKTREIVEQASDQQGAISTLEQDLKDEHNEGKPETQGTYGDLLQHALDCVNWYELAENMIDELKENEPELFEPWTTAKSIAERG